MFNLLFTSIQTRNLFYQKYFFRSPVSHELTKDVKKLIICCTTLRCRDIKYISSDDLRPITKFIDDLKGRSLLQPSNLNLVDRGNALHYNSNTEDMYMCWVGDGATENDMFSALSVLYYGKTQYAPLFRLAVFTEMATDNEFEKTCKMMQIESESALYSSLDDTYLQPITAFYLAKMTDRKIYVHYGQLGQSSLTFEFGYDNNKESLNILLLDFRVCLLLTDSAANKPTKKYKAITFPELCRLKRRKQSKQGLEENIFNSVCPCCIDWAVETCPHLFENHVQVKDRITSQLDEPTFKCITGDLVFSLVDIETTQVLPIEIRNDFVALETKPDGSCQYNAVSLALTGTQDLSFSLRRMVATEFMEHHEFYIQAFRDMKYSSNEIIALQNRIFSFTEWGNSETLLMLSKVTKRKIYVFSIRGGGLLDGVQEYDFTLNSPTSHAPLLLVLKGAHFQAVVPSACNTCLSIPKSNRKQFRKILESAQVYFRTSTDAERQRDTLQNNFEFNVSIKGVDMKMDCSSFDENIVQKLNFSASRENGINHKTLTWYLNLVKQDAKAFQQNPENVEIFVHNSSLPKFWTKKILLMKRTNEAEKIAKRLVAFQENLKVRIITAKFLTLMNLASTTADAYTQAAEEKFQVKKDQRRGKRTPPKQGEPSLNESAPKRQPKAELRNYVTDTDTYCFQNPSKTQVSSHTRKSDIGTSVALNH